MSYTRPLDGNGADCFNPIYLSKTASLNGRKVVHLPEIEKFLLQPGSYGITGIEPAFQNRTLANAILPEGWDLRYDFRSKSFTLPDADRLPKVILESSKVCFLTEKQTQNQVQKEKPIELTKKHIAVNRYDSWSETHPFCLIDLGRNGAAEDQSGLHRVDPVTNFASTNFFYGFFATQELAQLAKTCAEKFIEKNFYTLNLNRQDLEELSTKGYTTVNPFI